MEHYVTLFDTLFLPQGLALHRSLERHAGRHVLWILCVDDATHDILGRLALTNVQLLRLIDVETSELRRVKPDRSRAEYCWTLTPFTPRWVCQADPTIQRVTYVDADLWFRQSPLPIFREFELSGKHVLITDHAYAPEHDQSATSGRFCVQFIVFTRDGGERVRQWWEDRCVEWCYARCENGKFGDQKYLDDWPERFGDSVHVLQHTEWARAPWNASGSPCHESVFFHFHGLRLLGDDKVNLGGYPLSPQLIRDIYVPYLSDLAGAIGVLRKLGFEPPVQQRNGLVLAIKRLPFMLARRRRFVTMSMQVS